MASCGSASAIDSDNDYAFDTADRVPLPMNDTPGLDIALSTAGYLQTPDGTSLTRTTTQPTAARCDQLDATNSYDDYSEEQWFCFTTSEGVAGYLRIDDVIDGSNGAELTLSYSLFG